MANVIKRFGVIKIRVGGNTQENAVLVDSLDNGRVSEKQLAGNLVGLGLSLLTGSRWFFLYLFFMIENARFDVCPPLHDAQYSGLREY